MRLLIVRKIIAINGSKKPAVRFDVYLSQKLRQAAILYYLPFGTKHFSQQVGSAGGYILANILLFLTY